jgi:hypothetical protein
VYESRELSVNVVSVLVALLPLAIWCAWWLFCVNWTKLWPVLASGAWAPAVLLVFMAGAVWARLDPRDLTWPGYYVSALAWHLSAGVGLAAVAMVCGWLQAVLGCTPREFPVHPPAPAHGHAHADGHGHH